MEWNGMESRRGPADAGRTTALEVGQMKWNGGRNEMDRTKEGRMRINGMEHWKEWKGRTEGTFRKGRKWNGTKEIEMTMESENARHAGGHAAEQADFVVASIFVNPLQFAPVKTRTSTCAPWLPTRKLLVAGCTRVVRPHRRRMHPRWHYQHQSARAATVRASARRQPPGSLRGRGDGGEQAVQHMVQPDLAVARAKGSPATER